MDKYIVGRTCGLCSGGCVRCTIGKIPEVLTDQANGFSVGYGRDFG